MLRSSKTLLVTVLAGAAGLFGNATVATAQQPLTVNVTASAPRAQGEPTVILSTFTDEEGSWKCPEGSFGIPVRSTPSAAGCA